MCSYAALAFYYAQSLCEGPIRRVYLPIKLNGNVVCISEGSNTWLVTNANLKALAPPLLGVSLH